MFDCGEAQTGPQVQLEGEIFGALAPHVAGKSEGELEALADRLDAHADDLAARGVLPVERPG